MMPWEGDVYVTLLQQHLEEEEEKRQTEELMATIYEGTQREQDLVDERIDPEILRCWDLMM